METGVRDTSKSDRSRIAIVITALGIYLPCMLLFLVNKWLETLHCYTCSVSCRKHLKKLITYSVATTTVINKLPRAIGTTLSREVSLTRRESMSFDTRQWYDNNDDDNNDDDDDDDNDRWCCCTLLLLLLLLLLLSFDTRQRYTATDVVDQRWCHFFHVRRRLAPV